MKNIIILLMLFLGIPSYMYAEEAKLTKEQKKNINKQKFEKDIEEDKNIFKKYTIEKKSTKNNIKTNSNDMELEPYNGKDLGIYYTSYLFNEYRKNFSSIIKFIDYSCSKNESITNTYPNSIFYCSSKSGTIYTTLGKIIIEKNRVTELSFISNNYLDYHFVFRDSTTEIKIKDSRKNTIEIFYVHTIPDNSKVNIIYPSINYTFINNIKITDWLVKRWAFKYYLDYENKKGVTVINFMEKFLLSDEFRAEVLKYTSINVGT